MADLLGSVARRSQEAVEAYAAGRMRADDLHAATEALIAEMQRGDPALVLTEAHRALLAYLKQLAMISVDPGASPDADYARLKDLYLFAVDARKRTAPGSVERSEQ